MLYQNTCDKALGIMSDAVAHAVLTFALEQSLPSLAGRAWHDLDSDAIHFTDIATHGYFSNQTDPNAAAFFPLFPLLIDALIAIGFDPVVGAMLIAGSAAAPGGEWHATLWIS